MSDWSPSITKVSWLSISPTFYEQLLRQNAFAQKITNPNYKHVIAAQKLSYKKAAHNILVKLTPDEAKDFDETDSDLPSLTAMNHPEKQAKSRRGLHFHSE
jgi:hypothetical protein